MNAETITARLAGHFAAAKCTRCDFVCYGERDLEAEDLIRFHECDEGPNWDGDNYIDGLRVLPTLDSLFS